MSRELLEKCTFVEVEDTDIGVLFVAHIRVSAWGGILI